MMEGLRTNSHQISWDWYSNSKGLTKKYLDKKMSIMFNQICIQYRFEYIYTQSFFSYIHIYIYMHADGIPHGMVANMLDCSIVCKFKF